MEAKVVNTILSGGVKDKAKMITVYNIGLGLLVTYQGTMINGKYIANAISWERFSTAQQAMDIMAGHHAYASSFCDDFILIGEILLSEWETVGWLKLVNFGAPCSPDSEYVNLRVAAVVGLSDAILRGDASIRALGVSPNFHGFDVKERSSGTYITCRKGLCGADWVGLEDMLAIEAAAVGFYRLTNKE